MVRIRVRRRSAHAHVEQTVAHTAIPVTAVTTNKVLRGWFIKILHVCICPIGIRSVKRVSNKKGGQIIISPGVFFHCYRPARSIRRQSGINHYPCLIAHVVVYLDVVRNPSTHIKTFDQS